MNCENQMSICELGFVIEATYNNEPIILKQDASTLIYFPMWWSRTRMNQCMLKIYDGK